jgi:quercetin dioxygenase-like cupin family protein
VKKVAAKEGKTIQIGNARLTWKAMGADTAYGTSLYEMDLEPGVGIPVHSHPYAEVFYVIKSRHALRNIAAFASRAYLASDRRITPE